MFGDIKVILLMSLAAVALLGGAYGMGRLDGSNACDERHKQAAMDDFLKRTADAAILSEALENDLLASRNFYTDLGRQVSNEISGNDIYRSCIMPANGVFLVNSAIAGKAKR